MRFYIPLLYSVKVKKPNKSYFLRNIIGEDFIILLLTFAYDSIYFWQTTIILFLLQISFWCIYELGYIENDKIGKKFEDKPILYCDYDSYEYSALWQHWGLSFSLSAIAIFFIYFNFEDIINLTFNLDSDRLLNITKNYLFWIAFLIILRFIFYIYNHINKQSRVWFYLLLQTCRYCGYLILFTVNIVSLMFLISKIATRSIQYILYRYIGGNSNSWPINFPRYFFYLLIFILLTGLIAINERNLSLILNYQSLIIAIFCFTRGYKHFQKVFWQFVSVEKDGSSQIN